MPLVDVLDDTFVRAPALTVRDRTGHLWQAWLPTLRLVVTEDRGVRGTRWAASIRDDPGTRGSAEVWLEPVPGGTVVHLYVRLDSPAAAGRGQRRARRVQDRVRRSWKRELHRFKDQQERHEQDQDEQHLEQHGQEHPT